jgi:hypothetical protein
MKEKIQVQPSHGHALLWSCSKRLRRGGFLYGYILLHIPPDRIRL